MTTSQGDSVGCASPIAPDVLMDYWLAVLPPAAEDTLELHLLVCDGCGERLRQAIALAEGLHRLARSGTLQVIVSEPFARHAAATGMRVREYAPPPGDSVQCTVAVNDDLLVARLAADVTTAGRVDLAWCDTQGVEHQRLVDVPVHPGTGEVICQQSITWAKASPSVTRIAKLLAVDHSGNQRLLGEYTFHHTRTIPGAPEWELP